ASIGAVAVSAASMNVFAAADNGFSPAEIEASTYKPTVTMTKVVLDEVPDNKNVTVQVLVSADEYSYASTGFHIYFDKRVKCPANMIGNPTVKKGTCIVKDEGELSWTTPIYDETAAEQDMNGIFIATAGDFNFGGSGVLAEITLTLPDDAAPGDVYPLDIIYKSNPSAEDLFTNKEKDTVGETMQGWTFTRGIYNAETNYNFVADAEDIAKCAALADIDKSFDGYIAIADDEEPPVTTTTTTEAPATTTTTTTTAAPVTTTTTTTEAPATTTTTTGAQAPGSATTTTTTGGTINAGDNETTTSTTRSTVRTTTTKAPTAAGTTKAPTAGTTTTKKADAPKTGVAGVGVAVAGLAVAIGTAFVLRKKED
ncbi:MAG: NPXTG-anchored protein, partial [Ruminococcus sp.]|nr:NPXTG-anchored protein [Ruminococcus sp.]